MKTPCVVALFAGLLVPSILPAGEAPMKLTSTHRVASLPKKVASVYPRATQHVAYHSSVHHGCASYHRHQYAKYYNYKGGVEVSGQGVQVDNPWTKVNVDWKNGINIHVDAYGGIKINVAIP